MNSNKKNARIAGLWYLVVIISGIFSLLYIPSKLVEWNDASTTFNNISSSELLFKWWILSSLICYTAFIFLVLALYKLLKNVNKTYAMVMVVLVLLSVPISYLNLQNLFNVLVLISDAAYLNIFTSEQLHAQVMLSLESYNSGNQIAQIFWGLWLFPFGYLIFKSGFIPKFFGIFLMMGCFGYIINFLGAFFIEGYSNTLFSTIAGIPDGIGELGICLWLLIMGAKDNTIASKI